MLRTLWAITWKPAAVAIVVWAAIAVWAWYAPQQVGIAVDIWFLLLLLAVAVLPRWVGYFLGAANERLRKGRTPPPEA